ncbi:Cytochrome c subfamily, putative [Verrucomicrobiia bacterium DG1235]|nr:Cytochrome c subfamily, putative [Verrucomicrobiae bacterium DG1235]
MLAPLHKILFAIAITVPHVLAAQDAPPPNVSYSSDPEILEQGAQLFAQQCAGCHTLANDAIAPPLGGITSLLHEGQLTKWIREPEKVLASGDARANALLNRYKVAMPPFDHLATAQISSILAYIHHESDKRDLVSFKVATAQNQTRLIPAVEKSNLIIELEDFAQIPRLPNRPAYKGIAFMRPDPREDNAYFVSELMGLLYRLKDDKLTTFLDVREHFSRFVYEPGVATGLGSFAFHPDFSNNGIFYTTHAEIRHGSPAINADDIPDDAPEGVSPPLEWTLSEWRLDQINAPTFAGTRSEILRFVTPTTAHGSQEIDFSPVSDLTDPDYGMLYIACGDGGSINLKRPDMAGHPHAILGAIMRIDPMGTNAANGQYGIPPDNPFANSSDPLVHQEIWAYGFRNPHRFTWDDSPKPRMIAVDIGESNVEEINIIEPGGSYGWGVAALEGTTHIDPIVDAKIVRGATPEELAGTQLPHAQYDHIDGSAITGGFVYRGPLKALQGKYIFGDIVNGRIFYMNWDASLRDRSIYELNIIQDGVITDIRKLSKVDRAHLRFAYDDRSGDLFILTKDDGKIRRISNAYEATY